MEKITLEDVSHNFSWSEVVELICVCGFVRVLTLYTFAIWSFVNILAALCGLLVDFCGPFFCSVISSNFHGNRTMVLPLES